MTNQRKAPRLSYLVGGVTISLLPDSNTPGPRTHITSMCHAWNTLGATTEVLVASTFPFLKRFARVKVRNFAGSSSGKLVLADLVRLGVGVWTGLVTFAKTAKSPAPDAIYERVAVFQSMSSFHRYKRRATRIVEANGILSREAAHDRKGLKLESLAAAIEKRVLRRADFVVAVSNPLADELTKFAGIPQEKILVVPNGADSALTLTPLPADEETITIGFLGSLAKWHKLPDLIKHLAENWTELEAEAGGKALQVSIVGEGGDRDEVERTIAQTGMTDRITSHGPMPRDRALEECAKWSIGLAPHRKSSSGAMYHSPLKLYEYLALGLVVLATPSGDAHTLAQDGLPVFAYDSNDELLTELKRAIRLASARDSAEINTSRETMRELHAWETRASMILEAAGTTERARD